jgi:CTP:molybdopterin cytidylyltransferase MocA
MQQRFDVVVLAGYNPARPDLLAQETGVANKAVLPVNGKPMAIYVLEALVASAVVDRIVVAGLERLEGAPADADIHWLPNHPSGMLANVYQGFLALAEDGQNPHVLLISADVPLLTSAMVAWFLDACRPYDQDFYMGVVERSVMEAVFPESKRTYAPLVEGDLCNGQLYLVRIEVALTRYQMVQEFISRRKNVLRQLQLLGLPILLRYLFRRLRIRDVTDLAWRRAQVRAAAVMLPFAEPGMDVDKPHQLAQAEAYLRMKTEG